MVRTPALLSIYTLMCDQGKHPDASPHLLSSIHNRKIRASRHSPSCGKGAEGHLHAQKVKMSLTHINIVGSGERGNV